MASAGNATGAISLAARPSISARRSASSRRSRSASRARSSPCAPSISAARRRSSDQSFIETNFEGKVTIRNRNIARNSAGDLIAMARNLAVVIVGPDGTERAVHRIQFGAKLKVDEGDKVKRGQRIAEWDPYTRPILTEVAGKIGFEDLVEGGSMTGDDRRGDGHRQARRHRLARQFALVDRCVRRSSSTARTARSASSRAAVRPATCCRPRRSSRSIRAMWSRRATCSPAFRPKAPRRATSRAACRAWRSSSRRAGRRSRDHRGEGRHDPVRARLQEQAPDQPHPADDGSETVEYLDPEGQARLSPGRRSRSRRATSSSTAIPRRTTSWRSRASRSLPPIS